MLFEFDKKEIFLNKLKGKKNKYKRYTGAPIRYAGGKSLAVGEIIEKLPSNINRVISPFIGGGSVEIAIAKELEIEVIAFDIFDILVNFWQVLLNENDKKEMLKILYSLKPNKETFYEIKEILKKHWENKEKLDKITLGAFYFFNHNLSYGPGFLAWPSSVYLDEKRYQNMLKKLDEFNVPKLKVYCDSFENVLKTYPNDFLYLDPPYYIGKDSKMFKGIYPQRNFPIHHNNFPHETLRDLLKKHKGGFLLSYNDCPTIREYYKEYKQFFPKWQYTMGQGETRIGKNRQDRQNYVKESHEILIYKEHKWQKEQCQAKKQVLLKKEEKTMKRNLLI